MAKKSRSKLPECIYKKRGRYYWKVKLPGEAEVKARPLVPTGGGVNGRQLQNFPL